MKLGVSAFAWTAKFDRSHLRLVPLVKEMGFSGFEIAMFDPANLPVNEIRRTFEANQSNQSRYSNANEVGTALDSLC